MAPGYFSQTTQKITLTLKDALAIAQEKNWDIRIAGEDIKRAEEQINEAYSNAWPSVSFTGRYVRNIKLPVLFIPPNTAFNPSPETQTFELGSDNSIDAGITLTQVLYSQKVNTAVQIADEYAEYSRKGERAKRLEVTLAVKKAFYNVLLMKEMVAVSKKSYELAEANFKNVSALYNQGVASEYDVLRAEVQKANMQPALLQAENSYQLTLNYLKNLLALDIDTEVDVQGEFVYEKISPEIITSANETALANNPFLQQLKINESLLEKNLTIEKSEYYPTLAMFGQYQWQTQDNTFKLQNYKWAESFMVGLQLSYNIFDGFRRGARIEQVKIDKEKISLTRKKVTEGLKIQIQQAQMKMNEAAKRIESQLKNLEQAEKTVSIAETRFKSGIGTQLEIIDTQTALTYARTNYAQAVFDYLSAKADWEYSVSIEE